MAETTGFSITVDSPDMVAHVTGCGDLKRRTRARHFVDDRNFTAYAGETVETAIRAADDDLAAAYGETAYLPREQGGTAWTIASCEIAPCLKKVLKAEGITFDQNGEPSVKAR